MFYSEFMYIAYFAKKKKNNIIVILYLCLNLYVYTFCLGILCMNSTVVATILFYWFEYCEATFSHHIASIQDIVDIEYKYKACFIDRYILRKHSWGTVCTV